MKLFIKDACIVNEGKTAVGSILTEDSIIRKIIYSPEGNDSAGTESYRKSCEEYQKGCDETIEAGGKYLLPGIIDDQVHFREPGATHKGCIESESAAAVLGGVTSFMDMPNNNPPVCDIRSLEEKYSKAASDSYANYSFYLGANNDNLDEIRSVDPEKVCGIKVFMGSSTGNMLVDKEDTLESIFRESPVLIATHCEDEATIKANLNAAREKYGDDIPFAEHPQIRSREACILSSSKAIALAQKNHSRLHILHVSTEDEIEMISKARKSSPGISAEVCVHYLCFNDRDYDKFGTRIKCNPAIKRESDMLALRKACNEGKVQALATDHAPHLFSEKDRDYLHAPSGLPLVQHSLRMMLELHRQGIFSIEKIVGLMCHGPAECFNVRKRGFIREGYFADLVLVQDISDIPETVGKENIAYRCGWSPLEGMKMHYAVTDTFINGRPAVRNGRLTGIRAGERLEFDR